MARYRNFDATLGAGADVRSVSPALDDVRLRRAGLKAALSRLELALAAPFANRAEWVTLVREALDNVHDVWTRHIVETEAPGAFLDELETEAPRLSKPAAHLRKEHTEIRGTIVSGLLRLAEPPAEDAGYDAWAEGVRVELTALLAALARHRQRGADLVYEAYAVDLGGGY